MSEKENPSVETTEEKKSSLKEFFENLAALVKVKTIITFALTYVFCAMAMGGQIVPDDVKSVFLMVITFYFSTQVTKKQ